MDLWTLFVRAALVENLALSFFLGMCTFLAVSQRVHTALLLLSPGVEPGPEENPELAGRDSQMGERRGDRTQGRFAYPLAQPPTSPNPS